MRMPSDNIYINLQTATHEEYFDTILTSDSLIKEDTEPSETDSDYLTFLPPPSSEFQQQSSILQGEPLCNVKLEPEEKPVDSFASLEKERQKKENHNKIERRRRFNINDRIKDLGGLLPKKNEKYHHLVRDVRQNKGSILRATVEYVRALKEDQVKMRSLEEKLKYQEFQQRKLMRMLQESERRMLSYGSHLGSNYPPLLNKTEPQSTNLDLVSATVKQEITEPNNATTGLIRNQDFYDLAPVSMYDPMLSSLPMSSVASSMTSSNASPASSAASSCSSLDTMDLDVIEYQELRPSDTSLSSFLTYDCDALSQHHISDNKQCGKWVPKMDVAPGLVKMLQQQSKSHKIILQNRS